MFDDIFRRLIHSNLLSQPSSETRVWGDDSKLHWINVIGLADDSKQVPQPIPQLHRTILESNDPTLTLQLSHQQEPDMYIWYVVHVLQVCFALHNPP